MKFALVVIGLVALAVMLAGCTDNQEQKVGNEVVVVNTTAAPVYQNTENMECVNSTYTTNANGSVVTVACDGYKPPYADNPVVKLEGNSSYQLTGAEVQGCAIAAYIDNNGIVEMKNAPSSAVECPTYTVGRV
jgi:predicted small secreted protein